MNGFKNTLELEIEILEKYVRGKTNIDIDADIIINNNTLNFSRDFFDYSVDSKEFLGLVEILKKETFEYQVNDLGYEPNSVSFNKEDLIKDMKDFHNKTFLIQDIVVGINNKIDTKKEDINEYDITLEKIKELALKYNNITILEGVLENISAKEYKEIETQIIQKAIKGIGSSSIKEKEEKELEIFLTKVKFEEVDEFLKEFVELKEKEIENVRDELKEKIKEVLQFLEMEVNNYNIYKKELANVLMNKHNSDLCSNIFFPLAIETIVGFKKNVIEKENNQDSDLEDLLLKVSFEEVDDFLEEFVELKEKEIESISIDFKEKIKEVLYIIMDEANEDEIDLYKNEFTIELMELKKYMLSSRYNDLVKKGIDSFKEYVIKETSKINILKPEEKIEKSEKWQTNIVEVNEYLLKYVVEKEEFQKLSFETKKTIGSLFDFLNNNVENKIMLNRYKLNELKMILLNNKHLLFDDDFNIEIKEELETLKKEIMKKENKKGFQNTRDLEKDIRGKYLLFYDINIDKLFEYKNSKNIPILLDFWRDFFDYKIDSEEFRFLLSIVKEAAIKKDGINEVDYVFEEEIKKARKEYDKKRDELYNRLENIEVILKRYTDDTLFDLDLTEYEITKEKIKELAIKYEDVDFLEPIKEYLDSNDINDITIATTKSAEQNIKKETEETTMVISSSGVKLDTLASLTSTYDRVISSIVSNEVVKDNTIMNDKKTKKYNVDNLYVDSDILNDKDRKKTIFETLISNEGFIKHLKIENKKDARKILQTYLDNNIIVVMPNKLNNKIYNFIIIDKGYLENMNSINNPYVAALIFCNYKDDLRHLPDNDIKPYQKVFLEGLQLEQINKMIEVSKPKEEIKELDVQKNEKEANRKIQDYKMKKKVW
jgi:hypothetical protein